MLFGRRAHAAAAEGGAHAAPLEVTEGQLQAALGGAQPPLLVDVRSRAEYEGGHIPGILLLPLPELPAKLGQIPAGRPVVCVCRSGHRSLTAAKMLRGQGREAQSLAGGMMRWTGPVSVGS